MGVQVPAWACLGLRGFSGESTRGIVPVNLQMNFPQVKLANGKRAILLHYDTMNNPRTTRRGLDMQMWSYDDGVSWAKGSVLAYPPTKNTGVWLAYGNLYCHSTTDVRRACRYVL